MDSLFGWRFGLIFCLGGESGGLAIWEENVWIYCLGGESGELVV